MQGECDLNHGDTEETEEPSSPRLPQQNRNADVPVRMYRSVVLTSVRQFTDPGSPTIQKTCLELPASPTLTEDMDPKDLTIEGETEESDAVKEDEMDGPGRSASVDTLGYFNAAFEDFDEQEKEAYEHERISPSRSGLEVIRGNVEDFNEEDEEMMIDSTSSSDSSSESSESGSVKNLKNANTEEYKLQILQLDESYVVEVKAGNLPSPELPSMEVLNSRPITPDDFLTPDEEAWTYPTITIDEENQNVTTVVEHVEEVTTVQNQVTFEQLVIERFNFEKLPISSQECIDSPINTGTPPSTPAMVELNALYKAFSNASAKDDDVEQEKAPLVEQVHLEDLPPKTEELEQPDVVEEVTIAEDEQPEISQPGEVFLDADVVEEVVKDVQPEFIDTVEVIKADDVAATVKEIEPEIFEDPIEVMVVEVDEDVPAHFDDQLQVLANSRSVINISPHESSDSSSSSSSDSDDSEEKDIPVTHVVKEDQLKVLPPLYVKTEGVVPVAENIEIQVLEEIIDIVDAKEQDVTAKKDVHDQVVEDPIEMKVDEIDDKVPVIEGEQPKQTEEPVEIKVDDIDHAVPETEELQDMEQSVEMKDNEIINKAPAIEDEQPQIMEEYVEIEFDNKVPYLEDEQVQFSEDLEQVELQMVQEKAEPQIVQEEAEPQIVQEEDKPQIVEEEAEPQIREDPLEVIVKAVEEIVTALEKDQPHILEEPQSEVQTESSFSGSSVYSKGEFEDEIPTVSEVCQSQDLLAVKEVEEKQVPPVEYPIEIDEVKESDSVEVDIIEQVDPTQVENVEVITTENDDQLDVTEEPSVVDVVMSRSSSRSSSSSKSSSSKSDMEDEKTPVVDDSEDVHLHVVPSIEVTIEQVDSQAPVTEQLQNLEEPITIDDVKEEEEEVTVVKYEQLHVADELSNVDMALSKTVSSSTSSISSSESDNVQEEIPVVETIPVFDNRIEVDEGPIKSDSTEIIAVLIDGEKEAIVLKCPLDQNPPLEADLISSQTGSILLDSNELRGEDANDPPQRRLSVSNVRPPRKVSRDEGTQTDFCGYTGRLHVSTVVQPAELTSIIQPQTIPLQVEEMATTTAATSDMEVEPPAAVTTLKEIDADLNRLAASMEATEEVSTQLLDGEVFAAVAIVAESKTNEDVDSFYGSDKEVDNEVVFSHTDSSSSSSSSSESDIEPDQTQQVEINFSTSQTF